MKILTNKFPIGICIGAFLSTKFIAYANIDPNLVDEKKELDTYKHKGKNILFDPIEKQWIEAAKVPENEKDKMSGNTWSYNPVTKQWEKVNVEDNNFPENDPYKKTFWNDFGVSVNFGIGGTSLKNYICNLQLLNYANKLLVQSTKDIEAKRAHQINWMNGKYQLIDNLDNTKIKKAINDKDIDGSYFSSLKYTLHFGLTLDYNFAERFSIELSAIFNAMKIDVLEPSQDLKEDFNSQVNVANNAIFVWDTTINIGLAYNFFETEYADLKVKLGGGPLFFKAANLFSMDDFALGWNIKPALAVAYHVNGYFTLTPEIYYNYRRFTTIPNQAKWKDNSYIATSIHEIGIDIGLRINLAENIEFR